jgi:hypothetical protein
VGRDPLGALAVEPGAVLKEGLQPMLSYEPRSIALLRVMERGEWRLKLYSIALEQDLVDESRFRNGLALALDALPEPARTDSRPGIGFCILHQGRGADYIILAWWDRENELPLRVFVNTPDDSDWRQAQGSESVCVWDLEVIGFERNLYVATVLARPPLPLNAYIEQALKAHGPRLP